MNKNFELAKVLGTISLVLGIIASAIYLGFVNYQLTSYQFMNGREELANNIFWFHIWELVAGYVLFAVALLGLLVTLFFAVKGYRQKKI